MRSPIRTERAAAWSSVALCLLGTVVSAYLTYEHFTGSTTLACSAGGTVDCLAVTTSRWAVVAGVPVAVAGLGYFLAMTILCAPVEYSRAVEVARLVGVLAGAATVAYLVFVELFLVRAVCLWCTGVHVITLALAGTVFWWRRAVSRERTNRSATRPPADTSR